MANNASSSKIEIWKPVVGYEAFYEVSSLGRVRSLPRTTTYMTTRGRVTRTRPARMRALQRVGPYYTVVLRAENGKSKGRTVHSLVCEAWHGPAPVGRQVSHLNGNGRDNRPENLRWETPKENTGRKKDHGTQAYGEDHPNAVLNEDAVRAIRLLKGAGMPIKNIARALRVSRYAVTDVLSGRRWQEVR